MVRCISPIGEPGAEFTIRYVMLIHHDEVALAEAPPCLWRDYAAGKVN
jgi:hypothetical protein